MEIKQELKTTIHLNKGGEESKAPRISKVHQLVGKESRVETEAASEGSDFSGCDLGAFEGQETSIF